VPPTGFEPVLPCQITGFQSRRVYQFHQDGLAYCCHMSRSNATGIDDAMGAISTLFTARSNRLYAERAPTRVVDCRTVKTGHRAIQNGPATWKRASIERPMRTYRLAVAPASIVGIIGFAYYAGRGATTCLKTSSAWEGGRAAAWIIPSPSTTAF
jgi:hypothetical protein